MSNLAFITGGEGFLGRHIARLLTSKGWTVVSLGRSSMPDGAHKQWGIAASFIGNIEPHILRTAFDRFGAPALVIHAAGTSTVGRAAANPYDALMSTVGATAAVIEFLRNRALSAQLIYLSSAAVYGARRTAPIPIDATADPISEYGFHKSICEQQILSAAGLYGIRASIIRYFSVYGPGLTRQILWDIMSRIHAGEQTLRLSGSGNETRDFLFVEDAANFISLLMNEPTPPRIANGATGRPTRIADLVRLLGKAAGYQGTIEFSGEVRPGDPAHLVAEASSLGLTHFEPQWDLNEGIAAYVDWARTILSGEESETRKSAPGR